MTIGVLLSGTHLTCALCELRPRLGRNSTRAAAHNVADVLLTLRPL